MDLDQTPISCNAFVADGCEPISGCEILESLREMVTLFGQTAKDIGPNPVVVSDKRKNAMEKARNLIRRFDLSTRESETK